MWEKFSPFTSALHMTYYLCTHCLVLMGRISLIEDEILGFLLEIDRSETIPSAVGYDAVVEIATVEDIRKAKATILAVEPTSADLVHPCDIITKRRDIHTVFGLNEEVTISTIL